MTGKIRKFQNGIKIYSRLIFFSLFLCVWSYGLAQESTKSVDSQQLKICLNMIVKNESKVIERCLTSVLPIIDYWVIVDTGSTDGTQEIIKNFMSKKQVPGELYERPWVNFGHNRDEALKLAKNKGDYILFIDADEYFVWEPGFQLPQLDKDFYYINVSHGGTKYPRTSLIKNQLNWNWRGVVHEYVSANEASTHATLDKVFNMYTTEGARSRDPQKYLKDAEILLAALEKEPDNERYVFYLAQSYRDAGDNHNALKYYQKRAEMGRWDQEVFWSLLRIGQIQEALNMPSETIIASYNKAFQYRCTRAEPLYYLARYLNDKQNYESAYKVGKIAKTIGLSNDTLFVEKWIYDYGTLLELSVSAYWIDKFEECQQISLALLSNHDLEPSVRECIENNLGFANAKLLQQIPM